MSKSKNPKEKILTQVYAVLKQFRYGVTTINEIVQLFNISKQDATYWFNKLREDEFIKKIDWGVYKITEQGKRFCDEYERLKNKQLIRIENFSISYTILERSEEIISKIEWERIYNLKHVPVYQTHIEGHFVKLCVGKNPAIEINCKKNHDINPCEAYYFARLEIEKIADIIENKTDATLSKGVLTKKPEWAIPSPLAEALLTTYGASQIRTHVCTINRSKGRDADIEPMDLQQAQRLVDMPNYVEEIDETVLNLTSSLEQVKKQVDYLCTIRQNLYDFSQYN